MTRGKILPLKRRRERKTNYKSRLALLKSGKPRIVVRKSNNYIKLQLVEFDLKEFKEATKISYTSKKLKDFGWGYSKKNLPSAYLSGLAFGLVCRSNKIDEGVLDLGLERITKGNKTFGVLLGCLDAKLKIPHSGDNFPSENRIKGEHISKEVTKKFDEVKQKILDKYGRK